MRRYVFYLTVALVSFGFGSFVVSEFRRGNDRPAERIVRTESIIQKPVSYGFDFGASYRIVDQNKGSADGIAVNFQCRDAYLSAVWQFLLKDERFREYSKNAADCAKIISIEKKIDLNGDRESEAIVTGQDGLVNGANNQGIWIVQRTGKRFQVILSESVESYEIKSGRTNGFRDVLTKHHMSAASTYDSTYRFSRGKYRESKCLYVEYDASGKKRTTTCAAEEARIEKQYRDSLAKLKNGQ